MKYFVQLKDQATALLTLALAFVITSSVRADQPAAGPDDTATWVEKRVLELQPRAEEKRFDEIGCAKDIRDTERLAKQHQRPVFPFTHDGPINTGRC